MQRDATRPDHPNSFLPIDRDDFYDRLAGRPPCGHKATSSFGWWCAAAWRGNATKREPNPPAEDPASSKCRHGAYARERLRENLYSLRAASLRTIYILSRKLRFPRGPRGIKVPQFRTARLREKFQILKSNSYAFGSSRKM